MAVTRISTSSIQDFNKSNTISAGAINWGAATGGNYTPIIDGFQYHIFTTNSNFVVTKEGTFEYLIVAGGGGAGARVNTAATGGAGAGGAYTGLKNITTGTYAVAIGAGGAGASVVRTQGANGNATTWGSFTEFVFQGGGGSGGSDNLTTALPFVNGADGDCGGGGSCAGGTTGVGGTGSLGGDGGDAQPFVFADCEGGGGGGMSTD